MPQPDNRRERGAKTQTSQQTVAPTGQMSGTISPISGGAAAAAPVLQIGQQAQIKKTGAELYQAIAGVAQGVQQGIKNYEQMYGLVSETEYADFETSYIKENERVKGDPTKMKTWMDAQTYKPNRVTAKRYHTMKAQVNQKSYEEEQSDELAYLTRHMSEMTNADALEYANSRIGQYDENSPVAKGLYDQISKLQGAVVAQTQKFNDAAAKEAMIAKNRQIVSQLHDAGFPDSTSSDEFQMILAANSLGQATIDTASGSVTVGDRSYMLNALPENMPDILKDAIGNAPIPSLGVQAIAASKLPKSILDPQGRPGGGIGQREMDEIVTGARNAVRAGDTGALRATFSTVTSDEDPDNNYTRAKAIGSSLVRTISQDQSLSPAEKIHQLTTLSTSLGLDGENDPWLQSLGIDDEAGVRSFEETIQIQAAIDAQVVAGADQLLTGFGEYANNATDVSDFSANSSRAMTAMAELAVHGGQEAVISAMSFGIDGTPQPVENLSLNEIQNMIAQGKAVYPVSVSVIDPDLPEKVPFSMELTESGLITTGSLQGSNRATEAQVKATEAIMTAQEEMRIIAALPDPNKRGSMSIDTMQRATDRLARAGKLFAFVADNELPSGAISEAGAVNIANFAQENFGLGTAEFTASQDEKDVFYKQKLADLTTQYPAVLAQLKARDRNGHLAIAAQFGPHLTDQSQIPAIAALKQDNTVLTDFDAAGSKLETTLRSGEVPEIIEDTMEDTLLRNARITYQNRTGQTDFEAAMADPTNPFYDMAQGAFGDTVTQFSTIQGAVNMGALSKTALLAETTIVSQSPAAALITDPNSGVGNTTAEMDAASVVLDALLVHAKEKGMAEPWLLVGLDEQSFNQVLETLNGKKPPVYTSAAFEYLNKIQEDISPGMITPSGAVSTNASDGSTTAVFNLNFEAEMAAPEDTWGDIAYDVTSFLSRMPFTDTRILPKRERETFLNLSPEVLGQMMPQLQSPGQVTTITRESYDLRYNNTPNTTSSGHQVMEEFSKADADRRARHLNGILRKLDFISFPGRKAQGKLSG